MSPDGVRIFAGRPPYAVTPRPVAPEATPAEPVALEDRNAHLAQLRPRARAIPEVTEAAEQDPAPETPAQPGNLGGLNWAELQQYRPQPRPGG